MNIWKRIFTFLKEQDYIALLILAALVIIIRLPIDYKRIMIGAYGDYGIHIYYALDMLAGKTVPAFTLAHSFWELLLIGVWWLSRCKIDFWQSAIIFQVLSSLSSALIIYFWYGALASKPSAWLRVFWAVTLVVISPIIIPFLLDGKYYFGYIVLANYQNPTSHMLRPFALLMFIIALDVLENHSNWLKVSFAFIVFAVATFLKPNFTLIILPALGVMVLLWLGKRRPLNWGLAIIGIGLPSVLVLAAQYVITFVSGEPGDAIIFSPFSVAQVNSDFLLLKFLLSIFFPLVILLLHFKSIFQELEIKFAWLIFWVGTAQYYLLAEDGWRFAHGNFSWGLQISLFILFAVTGRFLLSKVGEVSLKQFFRSRMWYSYILYVPHLLAGALYYYYCFTNMNYV